MVASRLPRQASDRVAPKATKRTKVLATDMGFDKPVAKKRPVKKTPAPKKTAGKKTVAKIAAVQSEAPAKTPVIKRKPSDKVYYDQRDPRPERLSATERLDLPPPASGAELIERVSWAIERELNQIELIVGGHRLKPSQRTEAERRARTLASLARTLAVVTQLRAKNLQSVADDADDDAMPRDLDDLRETLARRLERLHADRSPIADGEPDAG